MEYTKHIPILETGAYTLAPVTRRAVALAFDWIFILLLIIGLILLFQLVGIEIRNFNLQGAMTMELDTSLPEPWSKVLTGFFISLPTAFFTVCIWLWGRTPGKWITGIRVVSLYHHHVGLWHSLERALGYIASSLEAGLGFLQVLWNPNRMALHDKIAETIVVMSPRKALKPSGSRGASVVEPPTMG
jgi:uncharacterized RDD family membrane protein YckC